jgi:hypothetical protein
MKLVYIASPYSIGCKEENVNKQIDFAELIMLLGHCPIIPLYSHYHELRHSHDYKEWIEIDKAKILKCDMLVRLPGESKGADIECQFAYEHNIPIIKL